MEKINAICQKIIIIRDVSMVLIIEIILDSEYSCILIGKQKKIVKIHNFHIEMS